MKLATLNCIAELGCLASRFSKTGVPTYDINRSSLVEMFTSTQDCNARHLLPNQRST